MPEADLDEEEVTEVTLLLDRVRDTVRDCVRVDEETACKAKRVRELAEASMPAPQEEP